jgi:hypothetical protein
MMMLSERFNPPGYLNNGGIFHENQKFSGPSLGLGLLFWTGLLVSLGCAHTKVTSFKDQERSAGKTYTMIAVLAPISDLKTRPAIEKAFVFRLNQKGVSATSSIAIIPPTRSPSKEEIEAKLSEGGYDALLFVRLTESSREYISTPGSATTLWGKSGAVTTYSGSNMISKPRVKFNIQLLDVASHQNVWISSTFTTGNVWAGPETLTQSLAEKTVKTLAADGSIKDAAPITALAEEKPE